MTITVLTPTGARPEAFAACVEMMRKQTCRDVRWIVVDDGPAAMPTPDLPDWQVIHVRPWPRWQWGGNTQARNILAGLEFATDRLAVVEDDDAYAPWWIERCNEWLDADDLVGESHALYRSLDGRYRQMHNDRHASLCSTALKGPAIGELRRIAGTGVKFIDLELWKRGGRLYPPDPRGVVGVKGYPGRPGIGCGHRMEYYDRA